MKNNPHYWVLFLKNIKNTLSLIVFCFKKILILPAILKPNNHDEK